MSNGPVLVVEVGGTTIRVARYDPAARAVATRRTVPTPNHLSGSTGLEEQVVAAIRAVASGVLGGRAPARVGVAWPGPIHPAGRVLATPTVYGSATGSPDLTALLQACWPGASVLVVNDITAAGHRYVMAGYRDFALLTVGSGIGHKVFLDGVARTGPGGRGGELGHLRVDRLLDAAVCDCGERGHLGGLASGRATIAAVRAVAERDPGGFATSVLRRHATSPECVDGTAVAIAFASGDPFTTTVVASRARLVGLGLAAIHVVVGIERFIVMGGFALALGDPYRALVAAGAAESTWAIGQDWDQMVRLGEADDDSALIGVGGLAGGPPR